MLSSETPLSESVWNIESNLDVDFDFGFGDLNSVVAVLDLFRVRLVLTTM